MIGPSVWLIDAVEGKGKMIIGPAKSPDDPGIYKPGSDVVVVGKKLYVGEEDSMRATTHQGNVSVWDIKDPNFQGNVSIWDISDPNSPKFIKQLQAGKQLPADFNMTHEIYASMDGRHVYAQSWASGYLVKIDGATDDVVGVVSGRMPDGICLTATSSRGRFDRHRWNWSWKHREGAASAAPFFLGFVGR